MTQLIVQELEVSIGNRLLIPDMSFTCKSGDWLSICAANGVGKSTLLKILTGILEPAKGSIVIDGQNIFKLSPRKRAQIISACAQFDSAPEHLLVLERIGMGLIPTIGVNTLLGDTQISRIKTLAQKLEISHLLSRTLRDLSGGEKKRVLLAKCLVQEAADVYLLDEPFASLDDQSCSLVQRVICEYSEAGKIVITTSPHLD